jgi:hypothetical protein
MQRRKIMKILKALSFAAVMAVATVGVALAESNTPFEVLDNSSYASIVNVSPASDGLAINGTDSVDIGSLQARVSQNPRLVAQLDSAGLSPTDVVGIAAHGEGDVTLYVQG